MILTCPNCSKRFLLSAQALAPEGRKVKCSSCTEEWFQLPDPDELIEDIEKQMEDIPESVKPIPERSSVPVLQKDKPEKGKGAPMAFAAASVVFILILAGLIFVKDTVTKAWPPSAAIYQMIGMKITVPGEGLVFDRTQVSVVGGKVLIEGLIINLTQQTHAIPMIEASLKDEFGNVKALWNIEPPQHELEPESTLPFMAQYEGAIADVESLHLRFVLAEGAKAPDQLEEEPQAEQPPHEEAHEAPAHDAGHH